MGAGWEVHASAANPTLDWLTSSLGSSRPNVFVERRLHQGQTGHTWALRVDHHQPWTLREDEVSPFVKGWIAGEDAAGASPLRQVVLIPDSLAFERDTLEAPLALGHALRVGVAWEGAEAAGAWRPRLAVAVDVVRPTVWRMQFPQDPSQWLGLSSEDVLQEVSCWAHRVRFEAGVVSDWRRPDMVKRSAGQLRASLFVVPGKCGASCRPGDQPHPQVGTFCCTLTSCLWKPHVALALWAGCLSWTAHAQLRVVNGGFESHLALPNATGQLHFCADWSGSLGTSQSLDYYHNDGTGAGDLPQTPLAKVAPHGGYAVAGLVAFSDETSPRHEYLTGKFSQPCSLVSATA